MRNYWVFHFNKKTIGTNMFCCVNNGDPRERNILCAIEARKRQVK